MGGCATKPKVLKGDEPEIPAPAPSKEAVPEPKEAALAVAVAVAVAADGEKKVEADEVAEEKYVIDDDAIDDQSNKRRSLSNLFQEVSVSNPITGTASCTCTVN